MSSCSADCLAIKNGVCVFRKELWERLIAVLRDDDDTERATSATMECCLRNRDYEMGVLGEREN